jgi:hypothetical protein
MAPQPEISQQGNATEKQTNIQGSQENKTEATANDNTAPEPAPGGWTFLQAMKMGGLKSRGSASAAASPPLSKSSNVSNGKSIDSKDNDELKVAQTNDSGDGPRGIGEIDALHEVRSDDELLGDEGGSSAPQHAGTQGDGNNGGENVEGTGGRVYKVYKRRWFGLVQLVLLNIIVSWDVSRLSIEVQPASKMSLMQPSVALFLRQLNNDVAILQCNPIRYQLAEHCLPLRFLRRNSACDLHPASWRPKTVNHHSLSPHSSGQLDQIWCHEGRTPWQFWGSDVWSDLDGLGSTICPCCSYKILRSVVH